MKPYLIKKIYNRVTGLTLYALYRQRENKKPVQLSCTNQEGTLDRWLEDFAPEERDYVVETVTTAPGFWSW